MPIRKVKEITREREESQFVAHPSACHSQGTNVTDVSAASSSSFREILDNEWTFLYSFKLRTHHCPRNKSTRTEGGGWVLNIRLLFIVWSSGPGTNWVKINEGVLFNKSNRLGEENTITGAKWYNSFVRWYPPEVRGAEICLCLQFSVFTSEGENIQGI